MTDSMTYDSLDAALQGIGFIDAAAEYHGALCGALCVLAPADINLASLIEPEEGSVPQLGSELRSTLERLRDETLDALTDEDMSFEPMLPDDDTALVPRVIALGAWCQGFLFGLASRRGLDFDRCSEELREVVHDLAELTKAAVGEEDDPNMQESAYTELVEYVRVGAQLVFMELHPRPTLDPSDSQRLH